MNKIYIFIILFIFPSVSYSQITITSVYNPLIGESMRQIKCDTVGINAGNGGANLTWNFTALQPFDTALISWVDPASTPYGSQFPLSNIAASDSTSYNYFKTGITDLLFYGVGNTQYTIPYNNPQTITTYPFTFNSIVTDNFSAVFQYLGVTAHRTGNATTTGDAWGTIDLPFGSFTNALRVKVDINVRDSARVGFVDFIVRTNLVMYQWYVEGKKYPVFEIDYQTVVTPLDSTTSKVVYFNSSSQPIGIENINENIPDIFQLYQNYPNPFNPNTTINIDIPKSTDVSFIIYDIQGRTIYREEKYLLAGTYSFKFDGSNFSSGIYYYKIFVNGSNNFSQTKKMILVK